MSTWKAHTISSTAAKQVAAVAPNMAPDPEVPPVANRRQFSTAYKLAVLEEADPVERAGADRYAAAARGLCSSHLSVWRRERESGVPEALGRRRGPKTKVSAEQKHMAALEARWARAVRCTPCSSDMCAPVMIGTRSIHLGDRTIHMERR
jgi:hypothetical protein